MKRYLVLLSFSEKGITAVMDSIERSESFKKEAAKVGAEIDSVYWTLGSYDGMFIISAPDEETAAGLVLKLGRSTAVRTCMLRAFTADEFLKVLSKAG